MPDPNKQIARSIKRLQSDINDLKERRDPASIVRLLRAPDDDPQEMAISVSVDVETDAAASMTWDEDRYNFAEWR